ncbi:molecular chaperone DnaJ [Romeria aff. gracilis LEGE 07310]|uniref:Molecular chaperone DnaJ n=1 Tax=Vasconcelosia minhoensis LEGE 07310 TaxID=915328 RepID=A0A8J7AMI9_9CYAN|nr:molecular chaperone DnaJ [Romeria gracilis]MBE9077041.1 molecular chaperone DnaJ [Romeria aff. gracilis LEGE 07310]
MQDHYNQLGLTPGASPAEIKAAYHAKLKAFPAHSHPREFKATRAAYEALRKAPQAADDFFDLKSFAAELDPALLKQIQQRATAAVDVTLADLILLTF